MADDQVVTNIVARADFSDLIANVRKVTTSLAAMQQQIGSSNKVLSSQINAVNRSFGETLRSTGQFSSHFVSLANDVDVFGKRLDGGKLKLRDYFSTLQTHTRTSGGLIRDLARQQVQLQNAILQPLGRNAQGLMQFNVHVPQGLDEIKNKGAIARQEMQILNKVMQEGAGQLINWGKNTQWAGRQLTVGLTVPIAAFGAAAAKAFREADQELTRLTKVYGGLSATSSTELQKVRRDVTAVANELARGYGASFKETLALSADIAATGKQGSELLGSIRETTRLAVLGEVDRQDAMKATLAIQSAFKQDTDELAQSINFLNAVENQTSTTLNDLVEAIPKAGPVIKGLGGDVQDLALYLTAMREGGINASEGANALKSALASLINPTDVAVKKFEGFGIDLMGIVNNNAGDITKTLFALQAALDNLNPLQKSQAIEQLFGKFQFARLSALFENLGKQGSQTLQVMDLMKASSKELATIASRELSMVTESASGKYKRAVEGLKADLAGIGEEFLKVSTFFINLVDGIVKFVNNLPGPIKTILTFLAGLTAVTGPLIMLTGVLANFLGYVIKGAFHLKALFKGGEGWRMLTPEILAANQAGSLIEKTFYSDAKAALALAEALQVLSAGMTSIQSKMTQGVVSVQPMLSTVAGSIIKPPGDDGGGGGGGGIPRIVDPRNPLVGPAGTRASAHMVPRSGMTQEERAAQTIHSFLPAPIPVNQAVGANPQIFASGDLPAVPGLTTITGKSGAVSTGVVSSEAAKWHTMVGTLSMMTKTEVAQMRTQLRTTGTVSSEFTQAFGSLLPQMTSIAENAAQQSAIIVAEAKAGTISVQTARQRIIALNIQVEQLMAQATMGTAASLGRTAVITAVPTLDQPVVDPKTGKSNMRELFKKGKTRSFVDDLARLMGVRTWGAGYSTHTTIPIRRNMGGKVYNPEVHGNVVPGDTSINYDNTPAVLREGGFILNQSSSRINPDLVNLAKNSKNAGGKIVPAILTPGETYFPPEIAQEIMPTLEKANSGSVVKLLNAGGILGGRVSNKKLNYGIRISPIDILSKLGRWNPNMARGARRVYETRASGSRASNSPRTFDPGSQFGPETYHSLFRRSSATWGVHGGALRHGERGADEVLGHVITSKFLRQFRGLPEQGSSRVLTGSQFESRFGSMPGGATPSKVYQVLPDNLITITKDFNAALLNGSATGAMWLSSSRQPQHFISLLSHLLNSGVPYKVAYRTAGRTLDRINKAMYRLKDTNLTETKWGNIVDSSMQAEISALSRSYTKGSMHSLNAGGIVPGGMVSRNRFGYGIPALSAAVIARLTSKWRKPAPYAPSTQKHDWTNTDPLHGPLFIGKADIGSDGVRRSLSYSIPSGRVIQGREGKQLVGISPMFSNDPRYLIERYMQGDKSVMARMQYEAKHGLNSHPLSIQSLFKSVARRFRGTLYRGMTSQSIADTFPKHIVEAIEKARATGDFSALIGREFIMRRASFTANRDIASFFAPGRSSGPMSSLLMEARLFGRRVTPTSKMFPDIKFEAPYGQNWSTRRSPLRRKSEEESLVGGKFTIIGFDGKKLIVEGRAMGGPVSGGTPYVVGERGPELFVPKNSGGIIPSYALGGIVKGGKINYGELPPYTAWEQGLAQPTLATQMRASGELPPLQAPQPSETPKGPRGLGAARMLGNIGGWTIGSMLGSKLTGGNQWGNILGGIAGGAAADAAIAGITNKLLGLGNAAGGAAGKTSLLTKAFNFFIKLPGPLKLLAAVVGVGVAIETMNNKIAEHRRIVSSGFGISEESAKKLGLQYKKLGSEIDTYQQKYDLMLAKAAANRFNQTKAEGKGINITVPELEKLKKQVAKDFPDEIKMFDKATNEEAIERATNLKAGMVAAGKSVEEANEIILAMIMNSNKSAMALDILGDRGFGKIQGKISATNATIKTFSNIIKEGNFDQLPIALQTSVNALDNLQQSFIKIDADTKKAVTSSQAYEKVLSQISGTANKAVGEKGLEEILAQNEGLRDVIDSTDTLAGIWAKIKLSTSGITFNLKDMSSETATTISLLLEQQKDYLRSNDSLIGSAADLIAKTGNITANQLIKNANKTKESIQKEIELRQKNIQRIKDEAAAKKKALDEETEAEDFLLQIQKKQIEYSEALASGDMARAAQAQLDIQSMTGARQLDLAKTAIDNKADRDIKKQQDLIDNLTKALDGLSKTLEKQISAAGNEQAKKADMQGLYDLFMQAVTLGMGGVTDSEKVIIGDIAKTLRDSGIKQFVDLADKYLKMSPTGNYVGSIQPMGFGNLESLGAASFSVISGKLQVEDTELRKYIEALQTGKTGDSTTPFTPKATTEKSAMGTKTVYTITPEQYVNSGMYVEREDPVAMKKTFLDYLGRRFQIVGRQEDGDFIVERKFAAGGVIKNFMPGGNVTGPGTGTSDSIPALLSNGEYVIKAKSVQKYGKETFDALNAGRFADGGIAQDPNKVYLPDGSEARKMSREERDANYRASRERFLASRKKYKETPLPELSAIEWVRKSGAILPYAMGGPVNASALITPSVPYYMNMGGEIPKFGMGGLSVKSARIPGVKPLATSIGKGIGKFATGMFGKIKDMLTKRASAGILNRPDAEFKQIVDSIYKKREVFEFETSSKVPVYTMGDSGDQFAFQGYKEDLSRLSNTGIKIVPTDPISLLQAALKLNPKDKNIKLMLKKFLAHKKTGKGLREEELNFLDQISASAYLDGRGEYVSTVQPDGFAMLLASLSGNKNAKNIVAEKTKIFKDIQEKSKSEYFAPPQNLSPEEAINASQIPIIHSTSRQVVRQPDGSVHFYPRGNWHVGDPSMAFPRSSVHTTAGAPVQDVLGGKWDTSNTRVFAALDKVLEANPRPYTINPTDTWFPVDPGKPFIMPKGSVIDRVFKNKKEYITELMKRGLFNGVGEPPLVVSDPKTNEVLRISKKVYTDADREQMASMIPKTEVNRFTDGNDPAMRGRTWNFGSKADELIGIEELILNEISEAAAKKQLKITSPITQISGPSLMDQTMTSNLIAISKRLGVPYGANHQGSPPGQMEANTRREGVNTAGVFGGPQDTAYSGSYTDSSSRYLALHGLFPIIKKLTPEYLNRNGMPRQWGDLVLAKGGLVKKFDKGGLAGNTHGGKPVPKGLDKLLNPKMGYLKSAKIGGTGGLVYGAMEEAEKYLSLRWGANENASGFSKWGRALGRVAFNTVQGAATGLVAGRNPLTLFGGMAAGLVEGLVGLSKDGSQYGVKGGSASGQKGFDAKAELDAIGLKSLLSEMAWSGGTGMVANPALMGLGRLAGKGFNKYVMPKLPSGVKEYGYNALESMKEGLGKVESYFKGPKPGQYDIVPPKVPSYFKKDGLENSQFRQDVEGVPVLNQLSKIVTTPIDRINKAISNFNMWDDTVGRPRKVLSAIDGILGLDDVLSTKFRPKTIKDSVLSMYKTGHSFSPESKWGFLEPGRGEALMKSRAGMSGKTIKETYIDQASAGAEKFVEKYGSFINKFNPSTWPGMASTAKAALARWTPKKIGSAISSMYNTGNSYDIMNTSKNIQFSGSGPNGESFTEQLIRKAEDGPQKFVQKYLRSLYLLNVKNMIDSGRTKFGVLRDKVGNAISLKLPFLMPGASQLTTPSFIKHIEHPGLKAILESFYMRHRVQTSTANPTGILPKVPIHPSETEMVTGRSRGPGMYFGLTSRLSREMYNFGKNVYRPKMNLEMLKSIFKSQGYVKGTTQLNALVDEFLDTDIGKATRDIFPESGHSGGVAGGLAGITDFQHPIIKFLMDKGYIGYMHGHDENALTAATNWLIGMKPNLGYKKVRRASGGMVTNADRYTGAEYAAKGNLSIPKFENGINMVPADMLAMLHKNEAVVPANMNPFNPNAQSYSQPSISYNIAPVINAAPGMDEQAIANMATRQVLAEIKVIDSRNTASIGRQGMRVVGNK